MGANDAAEMLEVAKEEVGRLERYNEELGVMLSDQQARYVKDTDILFLARKAAERERDAALAVIEMAKAVDNYDIGARYWEILEILAKSPADALTEHDRQVAEAAAERAAVISETAFLLHEMGTPGEGPFTNGQRYADEAREQIAAKIRAEYRKAGN